MQMQIQLKLRLEYLLDVSLFPGSTTILTDARAVVKV